MNFASKSPKLKQQPTYHLAQNYTTLPPPDGPLDLGTIVADLQSFFPINQGGSRTTIPHDQKYIDIKEGVTAHVKSTSNGEARFLARFLSGFIGSNTDISRRRIEEHAFKIAQLETVYFYPSASYIRQCLDLADVQEYLDMANHRVPIYLITGLKIARGATVSTERGRENALTAGADVHMLSVGPNNGEAGIHTAVSTASETVSSFEKPADFVLGIQVLKLFYKRVSLFSQPSLVTKRVNKNAVLLGDDDSFSEEEMEKEENLDDEETFIIAEIDGSDAKGVAAVNTGEEDEVWLISS
ncbi:hypothetical protein VTH82DRAFT_742 [Thermothelomyces myriococcoides]